MKKVFAIAFDGFVQSDRMYSLEDARKVWEKAIKNRLLYQYDCSVYELNNDGTVNRVVPYAELKG